MISFDLCILRFVQMQLLLLMHLTTLTTSLAQYSVVPEGYHEYIRPLLKQNLLTWIIRILEESGINSHLLLSILVKHLDHKNIVKQPIKQIRIVNVTTQLAQNAKLEASVAIIGAITELMKQLRKCMQCSSEASSPSDSSDKWNTDLQSALEKCILQLSNKEEATKSKSAGKAWYQTMISDSDYTKFENFSKWLGVS
ncbi:60S ribosomal protein L4 [Camellia lanceoleosa]|uniref:60S ribosomal protein L4 n=1 Tax=Camellia lanceoleosa TaxID=1840588 RepID=A0ACC0HFP3_9ERIC|nr:60S ribosomal protein L4 [Camellia lanceoleosa]